MHSSPEGFSGKQDPNCIRCSKMLVLEFFRACTILCGVQPRRESKDYWLENCPVRTVTTTAGILRDHPVTGVPIETSEHESSAHLSGAPSWCARESAEIRRSDAQGGIRIVHMIERVECFPADLQGDGFRHAERLAESNVGLPSPWTLE